VCRQASPRAGSLAGWGGLRTNDRRATPSGHAPIIRFCLRRPRGLECCAVVYIPRHGACLTSVPRPILIFPPVRWTCSSHAPVALGNGGHAWRSVCIRITSDGTPRHLGLGARPDGKGIDLKQHCLCATGRIAGWNSRRDRAGRSAPPTTTHRLGRATTRLGPQWDQT
jgi:hypothetical protein